MGSWRISARNGQRYVASVFIFTALTLTIFCSPNTPIRHRLIFISTSLETVREMQLYRLYRFVVHFLDVWARRKWSLGLKFGHYVSGPTAAWEKWAKIQVLGAGVRSVNTGLVIGNKLYREVVNFGGGRRIYFVRWRLAVGWLTPEV